MKKAIFFFSFFTLSIFSFAQTWQWAKMSGGVPSETAEQEAIGASTDKNSNLFITGIFYTDSISFDSIVLHNAGSSDIFIAKYSPNGKVLWAKTASGLYLHADVSGICTDASGNTYLTGNFLSDSIRFNNVTLQTPSFFLVKYDTYGNVVWAKEANYNTVSGVSGISVDKKRNVYVTGSFADSLAFDSIKLTSTPSGYNVFTIKFDSNGKALWANSIGGIMYSDIGVSVSNDISGNTYVTGYFCSPSISVGKDTLINGNGSNNKPNIFIVKYDLNGKPIWAKSASGNSSDQPNSISTDTAGNSYITGYFSSTKIIFGKDTLLNPSIPFQNVFVVKYDYSGNATWAKLINGATGYQGWGTAIDDSGNCYVSGGFGGTATFDTITLPLPSGPLDPMFLVKYDHITGKAKYALALADGGDDWSGIAVDKTGDVYVEGDFSSSTLNIGTYTLMNNNNGAEQIYCAKLSTNALTGVVDPLFREKDKPLVFPNPSEGNFYVQLPDANCKNVLMEVYNIYGEVVYHSYLNFRGTINLSNLPNGVYSYSIKNGVDELIGNGKLIIVK